MPQLDLAAASARDLRRLLDSARERGDAQASYRILQEMAARREGAGAKGGLGGRRREPRLVDMDLGDPMDRPEDDVPPMPGWRAPAPPAADAEDTRPLRLDEPVQASAEPADATPLDLWLTPGPKAAPKAAPTAPPDAPPPARPRGRSGAGFAIFTLGVALGTGFGVWAAGAGRELFGPIAAPPAPAVQMAAVVQAPPAVAEPPIQVPQAAVESTLPEPPPPPAPEAAVEAPPAPDVQPADVPAVETVEAAAPGPDACAAEPTPADRTICATPELQRLQRDLRRAYAEALDAHEDRALLRQRQLAWRDARSGITDPGRLTELYAERIRRLDGAAEAARRARGEGF